MLLTLGKKIALIVGTAVVPTLVVGTLFVADSQMLNPLKADGPTITLDSNIQPELDNTGSGTVTDAKGVTWEYHNASDYASGHVTLNADSYFGVSSSSSYGITAITSVVANFTGDELWLLTSIDGVNWGESEILTSGQAALSANDWRYIRFYNYSSTINIDSVVVGYDCVGVSSSEDLDGAHVENVISTTDNLTYEEETTDLSSSDSTRAVRFTKTNGNSTNFIISFGRTFTVGEIQNKKVEFDIKTSNINYGKTLQLYKNSSSVGSTVDSSKHSSYKITNIVDDWYHVEVPVTCLISTISGYNGGDVPAKNVASKEINAIKINAGNCVIDNLRICGGPQALGIYNNGASFGAGTAYWFKVSWVGKLHSCVITFDNPIAEQISLDDPLLENGSPFYIKGLSAGTVVATATVVCGYNHRTYTISNTLTINEKLSS